MEEEHIYEYKFAFELDYDYYIYIDKVEEYFQSFCMVYFFKSGSEGYIKIKRRGNPYQFVEIDLLRILIWIAAIAQDCHYIEETINTLNEYTGQRCYGIRPDGLNS
jgi:hypothetical protein